MLQRASTVAQRKMRSFPRDLFAEWAAVKRRIQKAGRVALFLDFDGTLAPIAPWPDRVRLSPAKRQQLERIVKKGVLVGIVSGRNLDDLRERVPVDQIWKAGASGYFFSRPGGAVTTVLQPAQRSEISKIGRRLGRELAEVAGALVELKQAMVAVHYRHVSTKDYPKVMAALRRLLLAHPSLHAIPGKKVWEILPNSHVDKWTAIQHILRTAQNSHRHRWLIFHLGDDRADERVFSNMKGIAIAVGKRRRTAAEYFLKSQADVGKFLRRFCEAVK